jgi:nicotinamide riboside kinase
MICINFYGGPGIGKSTLAARVFAQLKMAGIKTELVGEFAKDLVYDKAYNVMADQHYLFAQQAHRIWRLAQSGVEVAVCDSPLLLNIAYNQDPNNGYFNQFVIDTYKRYVNFDYVLDRNEEYWKIDKRNGDVDEAKLMDDKIDAVLLDA